MVHAQCLLATVNMDMDLPLSMATVIWLPPNTVPDANDSLYRCHYTLASLSVPVLK